MTNYALLLDLLRDQGMDFKWTRMFVKKLSYDERAFSMTDEQKKWAMERGFYPGRIELYGLTEENYKNYIPDYNYFMLHPMNNHFKIWLDKTTLKYVLNSNGCQSVMPDYFIYVENDGRFTYLMDMPKDIAKDGDVLLNLLKVKKILAMKPNSGTSGGIGFIKLEIRDNEIFENNKRIDMDRFIEIRDSMRNYIITEYVHQHSELAKIWPDSECTLRIIMTRNPNPDLYAKTEWSCAVSYARFGTSKNGGASNLSSGGIGIGFDFETGRYNDNAIRYHRYCENNEWSLTEHPDTHAKWAGTCLPNWEYVKNKIYELCQHISSLEYLGLDIIITEDGMKLCEINTHPAMDYEQVMCGPTLSKPSVKEYYVQKGLFDYDGKRFYEAYLKAQE